MRPLVRYLVLVCGWLFFGLGVVGAFVPVWPTTPFMLLAAACFMRSSERLHRWLVEHPRYGHHIRDYLEGRGLRLRAKVLAISTLWASTLLSVSAFVPHLAIDLLLVAIATGVTVYLVRLPTAAE
jgi:hypothetical protein